MPLIKVMGRAANILEYKDGCMDGLKNIYQIAQIKRMPSNHEEQMATRNSNGRRHTTRVASTLRTMALLKPPIMDSFGLEYGALRGLTC